MAARIDREELRALIRSALKEALGSAPVPPPSRTREKDHAKHVGGGGHQRSGRHPPPPPPSAVPLPRSAGEEPGTTRRNGDYRLDAGVLTETKVAAVARTHSRIVVAATVAITPLARDKARELKIAIERQKP